MASGAERAGSRPPPLAPSRYLALIWLALPTVTLLLLKEVAASWYLPTRVSLEFAASRINLILADDKSTAGGERPEIFDRTVPFSSLTINHLKSLRIEQLAENGAHGPVTLTCRDSNPQIGLRSSGKVAAPLGLLARIPLAPGHLIALAAPQGAEPAITLETEASPELKMSILARELTLETESCLPDGLPRPFQDGVPQRVKLGEASGVLTLTSYSRGLDLTFTPAGSPAGIFRRRPELRISSISLLGTEFEGKMVSALRGSAILSYLDYPGAPDAHIEEGGIIDFRNLSEGRLKHLTFDSASGAFRGRFEGKIRAGTSHDRMFMLTLLDIVHYSWYWLAVAAAWSVATAGAVVWTRQSRTAAPQGSNALKTRILFLGVSPTNLQPLHLEEEIHAIDRALASAALGSQCELVQKWAVRVSELQEYLLSTKPTIVHFSGHGSADRTIALQNDDGTTRPVSADRLARLLALFNTTLRCVVLNACYTKAHGEAIAEHIDCVIGMSTAVSDAAAIRFAPAFYLAVASGCSVKDAFEQAKANIELGELGEDEAPSLVAKQCDPGEVFLVLKR
jgi:hypothetical protein